MSPDFKARFFLPIPTCPPGEPVGSFGPTTGSPLRSSLLEHVSTSVTAIRPSFK